MDVTIFGFLTPGPFEMLVIAAIAVMLFGKRLPEVGKNLGKSLTEFKKGVRDVETNISDSVQSTPSLDTPAETADDREQSASAPRFEIPTE